MTRASLFSLFKTSQKDAETIFDADEPVGRPTDMVMPRKRWFGWLRKKQHRSGVARTIQHPIEKSTR
jgi:hypothetical protein